MAQVGMSSMVLLCCVVVLGSRFAFVTSSPLPKTSLPGLRGVIQGEAIVYMGNHHLRPIVQHVESTNVSIPRQSVTVDSAVGKITVNLADIELSQVHVSSADVKIADGIGITGNFDVSYAQITLNWQWQTDGIIKISDSGSATIDMSDASIRATVEVNEHGGALVGKDYKNEVDLGSWKVTISRNAFDWFYDLFIHDITSTVEKAATTAVSDKMTEDVNALAKKYFALLPKDVPFINGSGLEIDSLLSTRPDIQSSHATFDFIGTGYDAKSPHTPPFACHTSLPTTENSTKMVQAFLSQYVFNSLAWAYWRAGNFNLTFTNADIPSDSPLQLNTSSFKQVIPALYQKYPNDAMQVVTLTGDAPSVKFSNTGVSGSLQTQLKFSVVEDAATTLQHAFDITAHINASVLLTTKGNYIHGRIEGAPAVSLSLIKSSIGKFSLSSLQSLFQFGLTAYVSPQVDKILEKGIALPTVSPHITLENSVLVWHPGYVSFMTDYVYKNKTMTPR